MSKLDRCYNIDDLRKVAHKSLPKVMYDFIEGGAEDETTLRRNVDSFGDYRFVPRVLQDVEQIDLSTTVQGVSSAMPIICAPTGMSRMFHYLGEEAVAKAAEAAGIPYTLSTVSTRSIEDIAGYIKSPKFFQIYAWRNRELIDEFIRRCQAAGYDGIQLAVDLAALGNREKDLRNGYGRPLELRIKTGMSALKHPVWLYRFFTSDAMKMANMVEHLPHGGDAAKTLDTVNEQFDASVTWERAQAMREQWQGPFTLKGIQCVEDAKRAVSIGATGIILSNHGGRQLDGAPSAMDLLPAVVDAVGSDIEILIDGGVRRGADVIKAVALGAKACLIGRPYLYGLAAGGQAGVSRSLDILRSEMDRTMKLIGCPSIAQLDSSYVSNLVRS